jgi:cyclic pyranopterin phosphate synthase
MIDLLISFTVVTINGKSNLTNKDDFTHLKEGGVHMVDVGGKPQVKRIALAQGKIHLKENTIRLIQSDEIKKGNVISTSQIAAIQAVKSTSQIIPLCHPLSINSVDVDFKFEDDFIQVQVGVKIRGQTGVEMEALTGVSVALLTIWDMVKSVEKDDQGQYPNTKITDINVVEKIKE